MVGVKDMTTTSPPGSWALRAVPEPLESLGLETLSEVARSATMAQNLAGATRLQAAHHLVESMGRIDRDTHDRAGRCGNGRSRPTHARLDAMGRARDHLSAAMALTTWHAGRLVTAGVQVHTRLPSLRKAVRRGLFPEQLAIDTACRLAGVPDAIIGVVESDVVGALGSTSRWKFRRNWPAPELPGLGQVLTPIFCPVSE